MPQYQPYQRFTEADRDKIAGRLRDAFADGRLDQLADIPSRRHNAVR